MYSKRRNRNCCLCIRRSLRRRDNGRGVVGVEAVVDVAHRPLVNKIGLGQSF